MDLIILTFSLLKENLSFLKMWGGSYDLLKFLVIIFSSRRVISLTQGEKVVLLFSDPKKALELLKFKLIIYLDEKYFYLKEKKSSIIIRKPICFISFDFRRRIIKWMHELFWIWHPFSYYRTNIMQHYFS